MPTANMKERNKMKLEPMTKNELDLASLFCKQEKKLFWLCMYRIARNKDKLIFMQGGMSGT